MSRKIYVFNRISFGMMLKICMLKMLEHQNIMIQKKFENFIKNLQKNLIVKKTMIILFILSLKIL